MKRSLPATNEIYHIYNRGVERRRVFMDDEDRLRFVHDLFEFNDQNPTLNLSYHIGYRNSKEVGLPKIEREKRKLLVELMAFCMMPNHFHLIVRQKVENGITEFMRKIGSGYTNYFNKKYERVGHLFQGKYKMARLTNDAQFIHLPYYIHFNPLDLTKHEWRRREIKNYKDAEKFLETYRWSSHLDYIGKNNFPSVTQREFLLKFFGGPDRYKKSIAEWLKELDEEAIKEVTIE